ncbi:hypothetical protein ACTFIR_000416 [Dictyostelium discoideum]
METNPIILLKDKINLIKKNIENENDPSKLNDLKLKLNSCTDQLIFWEKLVSDNLEQSKQLKKLESDSLEKLKKLESDKLDFQIFLEHQPRVSWLESIFQDFLRDIICLCGFSDSMDIIIEHEFRRPSSKGLENDKDRKKSGQIFNYMCLLKHFHNLKQVIGITSTYWESKILWLQDDPLIHENNISNIKQNISKNELEINPQSVPTKLSKTLVPEFGNNKATPSSSGLVINRIDINVYKSRAIEQYDPDYIKTLCSVVQKMYYSEKNPEEDSNLRHFIQINSTSWFWVKLEQGFFPNYSQLLDIHTENPPDLDNPLLLKDLGSGADGNCWLAFNLDSNVFVIKFFKDGTNAEIEKFFWKEIWGINTHVTVLYKKTSLIMPYFKILTDKDWNDDRMLKLVKESCKIFSQKGYFHEDLSKRHVAKYTESDEIKIVSIDLSRVEKISVHRTEEMYSCIINDRFKQPNVFSIFDNINLRSSNTKQEQPTPFKAPKSHQ